MTAPDLTTTAVLLPERPELSRARRRLFEAALVLFGDRGYHGVSVRDIADALGQKPGAIYTHADSKQHLLYELIRIGQETHRDYMRAALLDAGREPADQLTALVTAMVTMNLQYPSLARVTNQEVRSLDGEQAAIVRAVRSESELMLLDVIHRGTTLGAFTAEDPHLAMIAIASMGIRAAEWWTPRSPRTLQHVADSYAAYALKLLT